jgi:hypothetical protein
MKLKLGAHKNQKSASQKVGKEGKCHWIKPISVTNGHIIFLNLRKSPELIRN